AREARARRDLESHAEELCTSLSVMRKFGAPRRKDRRTARTQVSPLSSHGKSNARPGRDRPRRASHTIGPSSRSCGNGESRLSPWSHWTVKHLVRALADDSVHQRSPRLGPGGSGCPKLGGRY